MSYKAKVFQYFMQAVDPMSTMHTVWLWVCRRAPTWLDQTIADYETGYGFVVCQNMGWVFYGVYP